MYVHKQILLLNGSMWKIMHCTAAAARQKEKKNTFRLSFKTRFLLRYSHCCGWVELSQIVVISAMPDLYLSDILSFHCRIKTQICVICESVSWKDTFIEISCSCTLNHAPGMRATPCNEMILKLFGISFANSTICINAVLSAEPVSF